ncbi:MAG: Methyltransferase type 11 [Polaromonas sp.]|nr:Methyltransferase type 11 [Polaromonas sp.]
MTLPDSARGPHGAGPASAWVRRWAHLVRPHGTVLDVACGSGRHAAFFHARGHTLVLVDRSAEAMAAIDLPPDTCEKRVADIEAGPWPFSGRQFDAVVVTHYLWRPLMPVLLASLAPGGVLIYETFAHGNAGVGKPSRPDFLLQPGELLQVCAGLRVVAFEDGFESGIEAGAPGSGAAPARFIQRVAAVREAEAEAGPGMPVPRYLLGPDPLG